MQTLPVRLTPGQDLRSALQQILDAQQLSAAFVIQGIGSLSIARIRYAGAGEPTELHGELEILTLAGSLSKDGVHLHMTLSDPFGKVVGGHVSPGCIIRTTAEILIAALPGFIFAREPDTTTRFDELVIRSADSN